MLPEHLTSNHSLPEAPSLYNLTLRELALPTSYKMVKAAVTVVKVIVITADSINTWITVLLRSNSRDNRKSSNNSNNGPTVIMVRIVIVVLLGNSCNHANSSTHGNHNHHSNHSKNTNHIKMQNIHSNNSNYSKDDMAVALK